ncbi:MAG: hypothetical protein FD149_153 [Rhodospirillaceae bacterium]|nr:MAG: hypothetical protein FD149_153 [Rhodospirillaceae bacterium]
MVTLFLVLALAGQVIAAQSAGPLALALWSGAVLFFALVWLTHKMTIQLALVLWVPWAWALGAWPAWFVPPLGLALAAAVAGPSFLGLQLAAHLDIVRFWNRHWHTLGAHGFRHSPVYGDPSRRAEAAFHKTGLTGVMAHLRLVTRYGPVVLVLPMLLVLAPPPPAWVMVWTLGSVLWTLLTLLVAPLKCLGGGHLYMFNAVMPAALWFACAVSGGGMPVVILLAVVVVANLVICMVGWRHRQRRTDNRDPEDFSALCAALRARPPARIAVFPLTIYQFSAMGC